MKSVESNTSGRSLFIEICTPVREHDFARLTLRPKTLGSSSVLKFYFFFFFFLDRLNRISSTSPTRDLLRETKIHWTQSRALQNPSLGSRSFAELRWRSQNELTFSGLNRVESPLQCDPHTDNSSSIPLDVVVRGCLLFVLFRLYSPAVPLQFNCL